MVQEIDFDVLAMQHAGREGGVGKCDVFLLGNRKMSLTQIQSRLFQWFPQHLEPPTKA